MWFRWLSLAAIPAVAISCSHTLHDDVVPVSLPHGLYDHPYIYIEHREPPFLDLLGAKVHLHVNSEPQIWNLSVTLLQYVHGEWVRRGPPVRWTKADLPAVGQNKWFDAHHWVCKPGKYVSMWITHGVSSTGVSESRTEFWPFRNWKSHNQSKWRFNEPATPRTAYSVTSC